MQSNGLVSEEWPSSRSTRSPISLAALLVKVTARMESGATPFSRISHAIRLVMTRVLPEPDPARISNGPSTASTAARCSGFRLSASCCKGQVRAGRFLGLVYRSGGRESIVLAQQCPSRAPAVSCYIDCWRESKCRVGGDTGPRENFAFIETQMPVE